MIGNWEAVLGINSRNVHIAQVNSAQAIRLVNNKQATKEALQDIGIPVVPTLHLITNRLHLRQLDLDSLPDTWVIKPNQSLGGSGILLAFGRTASGQWFSGSGREITLAAVQEHIRRIVDGEFSPGNRDATLIEPLLCPHPALAGLAPCGLPDIRIICFGDDPQAAMARLPTVASEGRANLHQGGIGAAVHLETGTIESAQLNRRSIEHHPDTNARLSGATIPHWPAILDAARRCASATGLHYLGADVVVDALRGPLVLEVNARPGLEIQNVNRVGLLKQLTTLLPGGTS